MEYTIDFSKFEIDTSKLRFEQFEIPLRRGLTRIKTLHAQRYDAGQTPDGTAQRQYSALYAERKREGKVKTRSGLVKGGGTDKPNLLLTGTMRGSIEVNTRPGEVVLELTGSHYSGRSNAELAGYLEGQGFGLHYFSESDLELMDGEVDKEMDRIVSEIFPPTK